jgi:uncharacterized protein
MIFDPTFLFARTRSTIDPELVDICFLDVSNCDLATARRAFEVCHSAAVCGSAFAMCMCSRFCRSGWGTTQSDHDAFQWATMASGVGFPPGYYELGRCYEEGIGVSKDIELARRNYASASEGGFGYAALFLAVSYHKKEIDSPDNAIALEWARRAYELNESTAALELARWYEEGEGVIKNPKEAVIWYARASALGNFFASARLGIAYEMGNLGLHQDREMAQKYEQLSITQMERPA